MAYFVWLTCFMLLGMALCRVRSAHLVYELGFGCHIPALACRFIEAAVTVIKVTG